MSVVVDFEEVGACVKKLTIEVPKPAVEAEAKRVLREFAGQVDLPGFRKGKVPQTLIRRRFSAEIQKEIVDRLVPRYWQQAQAEKQLEPLIQPEVEVLNFEDGAPMTFVASIETSPEISGLKLEDFDLPEGETQPTEGEVQDIIDDILRQHGTWNSVGREAARGDRVSGTLFDLDEGPGAADGDEESGSEGGDEEASAGRPFDVELVSERVDEQLMLALTGLSSGQTTEYTRRVETGDEEADEKRIKIEVDEVKELEAPEFNDEFAAKLGPFETVEELRAKIAEQLEDRKKSDLGRRREHALLDQLRERHPLELPERVVEQETQNMLREYAETLAAQGVDFMQAGLDWQQLSTDFKPRAESQVHARLLLDAIAKQQDIQLSEKRFEEVLSAIAQQQGQTPLAIRQQLSESGRIEQLRSDLLREQAVRVLLGEDVQEAETSDEAES